jgi:hypothetical protein
MQEENAADISGYSWFLTGDTGVKRMSESVTRAS